MLFCGSHIRDDCRMALGLSACVTLHRPTIPSFDVVRSGKRGWRHDPIGIHSSWDVGKHLLQRAHGAEV